MAAAEAARGLGFGARLVTGYLHAPPIDRNTAWPELPGTTHAWAEIYVPVPGGSHSTPPMALWAATI